ncbi:hypothetical protein MKX03_009550 [Papaver bracteatum]|nr:hypothetical protein MKX03_009550 [Papaver bracteatum]
MEDLSRRIDHEHRSFDNVRRVIRAEMEGVRRIMRAFASTFHSFDSAFNQDVLEGEDIRIHMKKIIILDDGEVCSICLQDMNVGDHGLVLKCYHIFHEKCMLEWAKRKPNCPVCRHDVQKDRKQKLKRKRLTYHDEQVKPPKTKITRTRLRKKKMRFRF